MFLTKRRVTVAAFILFIILWAVATQNVLPLLCLFPLLIIFLKLLKYVEEAWEDAQKGQTNFLSFIVDHSWHTGEMGNERRIHRRITRRLKPVRQPKPKVKVPRRIGRIKGNFKFK